MADTTSAACVKPHSKSAFYSGDTVETFQWLDSSEKEKDSFRDIQFTHNYKVRGPTYLEDNVKVMRFNCR